MELIIKKKIHTSPEKIFDAFTNADILNKWFTSNAKVDLRVNGDYSNADGDTGKYIEIVPNSKLVFSWENKNHCPGSLITVDIKQESENCYVKLTHSELKSVEDIEHMKSGWNWAMSNVKSFLEEGKVVTYEEWQKNNV